MQTVYKYLTLSFLLLLISCTKEYITIVQPDEYVPRTIWVPDEYEKIQDAIWVSEDRDVIMVRAGTYPEQLQFFDKNVSLVSESGPEVTTIDGTGFWTCAWITGGQDTNMVVRGFTWLNNSDTQSMCLNIYGGASPRIVNNIMTVPNGDGMWTGSTAAIIRNNLIINVENGGQMGRIWGDFSNNMIIHASRFGIWNSAVMGQPLVPDYNLFWENNELINDFPIQWGENNIIDREPIFIEDSYRMLEGSPGIDQGRPDLRDPDGSRSDIGVHGGPYAYKN